MLPSVDTYLSSEIRSKMKIILSNRYIIEEILKDIQPKVSDNFINTYCGEKGRELPIVYTMPQEKVTQQGAIYIGLKEGKEDRNSLGNIEDTYSFKEQGIRKERSIIQATEEKDRIFFEVEKPIGRLINVENIEFSSSDNVTTEDNRIYFKYDPELIGFESNVNYMPTYGDEAGTKKGFTATEMYSVVALSTNMDVVRCIDLLLKAIFILTRDNPEEQNSLVLQNLHFFPIEEINVGTVDGKTPEILYGRETVVSYTVSYNLDAPFLIKLKEAIVNIKSQ